MKPLKTQLLSSTVIPVLLVAGVLTAGGPAQSVVPSPKQVAANPCAAKNPCAARNPCNPCAARNPCNPCAAKNPCNPCAAKNPCNPCGAAAAVTLTKFEAIAVYNCLFATMQAGYAKSGNRFAGQFVNWPIYNSQPYISGTHGGRLVNNYGNYIARQYAKFEKAGKMPAGSALAKDSFAVMPNGRAAAGPLFLMEKMRAGFLKASGDWRYTLIMPNGAVVGSTKGKGSANVKFCHECHMSVAEDQDSMLLLPEEYRIN